AAKAGGGKTGARVQQGAPAGGTVPADRVAPAAHGGRQGHGPGTTAANIAPPGRCRDRVDPRLDLFTGRGLAARGSVATLRIVRICAAKAGGGKTGARVQQGAPAGGTVPADRVAPAAHGGHQGHGPGTTAANIA